MPEENIPMEDIPSGDQHAIDAQLVAAIELQLLDDIHDKLFLSDL